ncbi:AAA family ATPase [Sphingobium boeckii]|uniref:RecA-family ATPase n=1 Tax=Sphingobium boeckii TaxID=1082345 RepID=A0A7W9AHR9_9SPHN|nr:AAA family ATPase [Sphingobium boeckii]MBB5685651.1 RecA-family ATPase [Sphingobium boeckii]
MSQLAKIAAAMGGEVSGTRAMFPTPGHSKKDRGSWASLAPTAPDGVLIHSENGGDPLAIKDELRAKGVLPKWEPSRPRTALAPKRKPREPGRTYFEFQDADGVTVCRKVRIDKPDGSKTFQWQHPDGVGGWRADRGCDPLPYRLPDILAAALDVPVYIAEGEQKADKLASWGFVATSSKDLPGDLSVFADRTVIILPDNDKAGARIAGSLQSKLDSVAAECLIIELPGLAEGEDIMEWGGTADDLQALAHRGLTEPVETFELADLNLWAATKPTPKTFLMAPFIPREDVVIITGDGGTNKSTLALQISACAAAGRKFLGMDVIAGPALYITAEDDNRENHWRLAKIAEAIGTTLHALAGQLHIVSLRGRMNNELATFEHDGRMRSTPAYALLRATIVQTGAKLVTLDNVAHLFAGNENDRSQVTAFINLLYQLCGDLDVTVLLIAHRNKTGDSYSGSTAWLNAVRSQVLMERSDDADPDIRRMSLGKANYARAGEDIAFRWHDFALVRDKDLPADTAKEIAAVARTNADNAIFLACLAERNDQRRQVSEKPTAANYAPKQFEVMPQAKGLNRKRLADAMDRLYRIGAIERGFLYRDTGEGKDIHGLREATPGQPETSPETSRKQQPETSGNPQKTTGNTQPIYKYIPGASLGADAPSHEEEDDPDPFAVSSMSGGAG